MSVTLGLYVFPGVELLDVTGPAQVFATADRMLSGNHAGAEGLRVVTIAREPGSVVTRAGLALQAGAGFADHPLLDGLVVPGGAVGDLPEDAEVDDWIGSVAATARFTASVCTGAFLLARAGLLEGCRATTHWEDIPALRGRFPGIEVHDGPRWIDEGRLLTSGGVSAGMDMSLHLVARLAGRDVALATARQMDYAWQE
ncbi:MAG: DJ-1/PfpI family protein [Ectothiorhodospiraceae bacterium]